MSQDNSATAEEAADAPGTTTAAAEGAAAAAGGEGLVVAMRKATRRQHHIANALILAKLAVALTDRKLYGQALGQFLPVYAELEAVLSKNRGAAGLEEVATLVLSVPSRAEAMQRDLQHLLGPQWRSEVPPSRSAESYAAHLREVATKDPALLIPYAWSLNVPILLPFMGRRIAKGLGLECDGAGVEFFKIPGKEGRLPELRAAVNRAGTLLSEEQRHACLEEAVEQFRRNNSVVAEFRLPLGSAAAAIARALLAARVLLRPAFLAAVMVAAVAALWARQRAGAAAGGPA